MAGIVVLGSLNMDLVVSGGRLPTPGETVLAEHFGTFAGGKGANQAVATARLGAEVAMLGRVGEDSYGAALLTELAREGVDVAGTETVAGSSTGVAVITVDTSGENTISVAPGANALLAPEDLVRHDAALKSASTLLVQLECPVETVARGAEIASDARVVLNAAPARALPVALLRRVDTLIVNRGEAVALTRLPETSSPEVLLAALTALGPPRVVLTLGPDGARALEDGALHEQPGFEVAAVDAVGAGDAFTAACTVALDAGRSLSEAVRRGCAAGALACTREGAQSSMPYARELEEILRA